MLMEGIRDVEYMLAYKHGDPKLDVYLRDALRQEAAVEPRDYSHYAFGRHARLCVEFGLKPRHKSWPPPRPPQPKKHYPPRTIRY